MQKTYYFDWHLDLDSSPQALWPFVADTNRFNRDTGLPAVTHIQDAPDVPPGMYRLAFRIFGQRVVWDEAPFDWVYPYQFGVLRTYRAGPVQEMRVQATLAPREKGGTHLRYEVWARPANVLGHVAIPVQIGLISARRFAAVFKMYDALARQGQVPFALAAREVRFAPGGRERLAAARRLIVVDEDSAVAYEQMRALLYSADDLSLQRIRPYQMAAHWSLPRRSVLETMLRAARAGVLDMRWELICPQCRGVGESHATLSGVHNGAHCSFCNMNFDVDFDRQVEVVFRPNGAVRPIPEAARFCLTGPHSEPHRAINASVPAGEVLEAKTALEAGEYTLFCSEHTAGRSVLVGAQGNPEPVWILSEKGWAEGDYTASLSPRLRIENRSAHPQHIVLERSAWRDDAATAADVTSLQIFRDLFSREALRPGEEIGINSVTLLFTDLRDSTRMYNQIGDASAFGRVRAHFEILEEAIAAEGGAVVKTIGDAVMAVFRQPVGALRAICAAHAAMQRIGGSPQLYLKAGIHSGPCIAVTLNERLDYFGSTVNIAARLPGFAEGGEVVFSKTVYADPEVQRWLTQAGTPVEAFQTRVKGFDDLFEMYKLKPQKSTG